jgi:hypothetical protein
MATLTARGWMAAAVLAAAPGCGDPCRTSAACADEGRCVSHGNVCVAHEDRDCRASAVCKKEGRCRAMGRCVAGADADCAVSDVCRQEGRCAARPPACIAVSAKDCTNSDLCREATRCALGENECVPGPPYVERPPSAAPRGGTGQGFGGCPCGCDRSEEMAGELRTAGGDGAIGAIAETLRIIAEREDAGYITEAMVEHRLRLLDVRGELATAAGKAPEVAASRDRGVPMPAGRRAGELARTKSSSRIQVAEDAALRVRAELTAHGETTELVRGREKALRASFRLGIDLRNLTDEELTLEAPVLEGAAGFPVRRWYLVGGDGRAWDGRLGPRETRSVNVVGYLGAPVEPGAELEATVRLRGIVLHAATRALGRWDEEPFASCARE